MAGTSGYKDVAEGDDAVAPFGNDGGFENDCDAGGLCQVVTNPFGERFLRKDSVDGENEEREECGRSHEDPNEMTKQEPGDESSPFIRVPWSHTADGCPFEPHAHASPEAISSG